MGDSYAGQRLGARYLASTSTPYLASGWRRFCQRHEIMVGHFVVFNYNGEHQIMVSVFDQTMCRRYYVAIARGKAAVSSSSEDDQ
jgi:hypothetical protein